MTFLPSGFLVRVCFYYEIDCEIVGFGHEILDMPTWLQQDRGKSSRGPRVLEESRWFTWVVDIIHGPLIHLLITLRFLLFKPPISLIQLYPILLLYRHENTVGIDTLSPQELISEKGAGNPNFLRFVSSDMSPDPDERFKSDPSAFLRSGKYLHYITDKNIESGVAKFFVNQPTFDIRKTSVMTAAAVPEALKGISEKDRQNVIDYLCKIQRVLAFASSPHELHGLLACGLTSAYKVASISKTGLSYMLGVSLSDAKSFHKRATAISHRNQTLLTSLYRAVRGIGH